MANRDIIRGLVNNNGLVANQVQNLQDNYMFRRQDLVNYNADFGTRVAFNGITGNMNPPAGCWAYAGVTFLMLMGRIARNNVYATVNQIRAAQNINNPNNGCNYDTILDNVNLFPNGRVNNADRTYFVGNDIEAHQNSTTVYNRLQSTTGAIAVVGLGRKQWGVNDPLHTVVVISYRRNIVIVDGWQMNTNNQVQTVQGNPNISQCKSQRFTT